MDKIRETVICIFVFLLLLLITVCALTIVVEAVICLYHLARHMPIDKVEKVSLILVALYSGIVWFVWCYPERKG